MRRQFACFAIVLTLLPSLAFAANVFGGKVSTSIPCYNNAIWNTVGAPRGGIYIWTPSTRTYPFGPPATGKWVLGLYGVPYFCIVSLAPLIVFPGITMTMLGSSGPSAPSVPTSPPPPAPSQPSLPNCDLSNGQHNPAVTNGQHCMTSQGTSATYIVPPPPCDGTNAGNCSTPTFNP